jgi:hypothetical protein
MKSMGTMETRMRMRILVRTQTSKIPPVNRLKIICHPGQQTVSQNPILMIIFD